MTKLIRTSSQLPLFCLLTCLAGFTQANGQGFQDYPASVERGRYLVRISGCNDCHTPGYAQREGDVPEQQWLTGDRLGWHGPWGTTYAANLRLLAARMSEPAWLSITHNLHSRPPMPSAALRQMKPDDLASIYRFIRALGPAGEPEPDYLPPDRQPSAPFVQFPQPSQGPMQRP